MEYVVFALIIAGAYLLGSLNLSYLAGKRLAGIDLREVGSGNLGTENVFRNVGKGIGVFVFFGDCAEEALVVLVLRVAGLDLAWQAAGGLAVIAGHNWPVFLGFEGGRGMAMTLTGTLILLPWEGLVMVGLLALGGATHHTPEMNLLALALTPVIAWFLGRELSLMLFAIGLFVMGVLRRLQGSPRVGEKRAGEDRYGVLWNRLIYDRETRAG